MSVNDSKQKQTVDFVLGKQATSLKPGQGFATMAAGGRLPGRPHVGRASKPYEVVAKKQIGKMCAIEAKRNSASMIMSQAVLNSVAGMAHTLQIAFAIARSIQDEEQLAFMEEYVRNIINLLSITEAEFLELLRGQLEELIQEGVDPSFLDQLQAWFSS
jgi:hypothetical protein